MRKKWWLIGWLGLLITACVSETSQPYAGEIKEVEGAEIDYEPFYTDSLKNYKIKGKTYKIEKDFSNYSQVGYGSYYHDNFHGKKTAIGEIMNNNEFTAAHATLPLPSYVRVTNLNNGNQLIVRLNDRGPFVKGRIIDLSKRAATQLKMTEKSRLKVDFITVDKNGTLAGPGMVGSSVVKKTFALPTPDLASLPMPLAAKPAPILAIAPSTPGYKVQIAALANKKQAEILLTEVTKKFGYVGKVVPAGKVFRIVLGPFESKLKAEQALNQLKNSYKTAFIGTEGKFMH